MNFLIPLATIFWDPNPDIFRIPYLDHPLKWYGLLFMGGILAGFFLLIPLIKQKLLRTTRLQERDVNNWPKLQQDLLEALSTLSNPLNTVASNFDKKTKTLLLQHQELPPSVKQNILKELSTIDRKTLDALLPNSILTIKNLAYNYVDGLMWWIVLGIIIGARLGHVFFYDWARYQHHWLDIFKIWEGGLASHGGTLGVLAAVYGYTRWTRNKFPEINFLTLTDLICIPTAFAVIFIRIGNFVNQEILGTPTSLPWAVIFGHAADGTLSLPRHPVQLYEAIAYFFTFLLLSILWWSKKGCWPTGFITGVLFLCIFGSRFFLEFFKAPLESTLNESYLQAGQLLSLPFIIFGFALIYYSQLRSQYDFYDRYTQS